MVSDVSVKYAHEEYTPKLKSGSKEQGLDTQQAYNMQEDEYNATLDNLLASMESDKTSEELIMAKNVFLTDYETFYDSFEPSENEEVALLELYDVTQYLDDAYRDVVAIYFNKLNNRYSDAELASVVDEFRTTWISHNDQISDAIANADGDMKDTLTKEYAVISDFLSDAGGHIGR